MKENRRTPKAQTEEQLRIIKEVEEAFTRRQEVFCEGCKWERIKTPDGGVVIRRRKKK